MSKLCIIMPTTGSVSVTVDLGDRSHDELTDDEVEELFWKHIETDAGEAEAFDNHDWEYTPQVSRGDVCYAHTKDIDWQPVDE